MQDLQKLHAPVGGDTMKSPTTTGTDMHRSRGDRVFTIAVYVFLGFLMLGMIVPFINVLAVAFSAPLASMEPGIILWPQEFSVDGFRVVWTNLELERAFINS